MVTAVKENQISSSDSFTAEQGLMLSFGLESFYGPAVIPKEVGTIDVVAKEWGYDQNQEHYNRWTTLSTHQCTDYELGLDDEGAGARLFPNGFEEGGRNARGTRLCIDSNELGIKGTYSSNEGRILSIVLNRCMGDDFCLSEQEAKKWLRGRYLILETNRIRFNPESFGTDSIIREHFEEWIPITTFAPIEVPYQISQTEVKLQDLPINFDELTELVDSSCFSLHR
eukprot:CAMPEP_0185582810 /NCGR_PEP_ID=MMETSP0434-20130131/21140_1 /TAXON_ID=626734 ORGANISM="Favella taraikaensis, Strain Fe Narragansett Bay" /NCGR_SAMPLE_ID=MMETSP0434 /ASSEMBLY_ACC=CAM_ASM_000379 /LENGTH=225 /DNA_ID=CAMNT_0028201743 /DNA_START=150 /DNA_END=827 /DNA_ORIENTATION=+